MYTHPAGERLSHFHIHTAVSHFYVQALLVAMSKYAMAKWLLRTRMISIPEGVMLQLQVDDHEGATD